MDDEYFDKLLSNIKLPYPKTTRKILRSQVNFFFPLEGTPIIICSIGRSGSTLIYKSIGSAIRKKHFKYFPSAIGQQLTRGGGYWFPKDKLFPGRVHKSHMPPEFYPNDTNANIIFLYSRPSDSVLSVLSNKNRNNGFWIKQHFENLNVKANIDLITKKDILGIEKQIDGWLNKRGVKRLILKYEKIWENKSEIEEFLNLPLNLPDFKKRSPLSHEASNLEKECRHYYQRLDKKFEKLEDIYILD